MNPEDFVDHVIHTQQAKNSLISEAGASPFQIAFGRNLEIPQARAQKASDKQPKALLECHDRALRGGLRACPRLHRGVVGFTIGGPKNGKMERCLWYFW